MTIQKCSEDGKKTQLDITNCTCYSDNKATDQRVFQENIKSNTYKKYVQTVISMCSSQTEVDILQQKLTLCTLVHNTQCSTTYMYIMINNLSKKYKVY